MTRGSGNMRCMRIFAGVPLGGGVKWEWGCPLSTTAIFGDLNCYFFGNLRDKASNIIRQYVAPFRPVIDCKMNDLEWPWAAMSTNLQFSRCYIFVSFGNNVDIGLHYHNNPFWSSVDTNKDDLEWPWTPDSSQSGHNSAKHHPIHFVFDSRVRFSPTAGRTALFLIQSNPRWRPAAILKISNGLFLQYIIRFCASFMCVHRPYTLPSDAVKTLDAYEIRHLFSKGG